jgi:hypothetical protein
LKNRADYKDFINHAYFRGRILETKLYRGKKAVAVLVPIAYKKEGKHNVFGKKLWIYSGDHWYDVCNRLIGVDVYIICRVIIPPGSMSNVTLFIKALRRIEQEDKDIDWNYEKRKFYENLENGGGLGLE